MYSTELDPKMTQMLKLADKNFKVAIIKIRKAWKGKMVKMSGKMRNLEGQV